MRVRYAHFEETHKRWINTIILPTRNRSEEHITVPAVVLLVIVLEVRCNLFEVSVKIMAFLINREPARVLVCVVSQSQYVGDRGLTSAGSTCSRNTSTGHAAFSTQCV